MTKAEDVKATPGPWTTEGFTIREEASDAVIAVIQDGNHINQNIEIFDIDTQEANARLIASAPQLLEALKYAAQIIGHPDDAGNKPIYDAIRAAGGGL